MSEIKKQLFEQLALIAHSLGSPQRMELLDYLAQAERSVDELSQLSDLSIANTSRHLQVLKKNGLVQVRKKGKKRLYQLAGDDVVDLVSSLRNTAEKHLAEIDRLKRKMNEKSESVQSIGHSELLNQLDSKALLLLDIRPKNEYKQGHIKGAVNIAPEEIEDKAADLNAGKTIVAYCRGPYCVYSNELIESLNKRGVNALKLKEGFPEWRAAGLPFETCNSK